MPLFRQERTAVLLALSDMENDNEVFGKNN